ncbi:MAG: PAS domain-containing sensor histidine kinase [Helicobacter sp.]|nr:PAS domain-containing sensor histidine kinase [Helicobacter sp.]
MEQDSMDFILGKEREFAPLIHELENVLQDEVKNRLISEQHYQQLFHSANDAIFLLSAKNFTILRANLSAHALLGIDNMYRLDFLQFLQKDAQETFRAHLQALCLQEVQNFTFPCAICAQNRAPIPVEISAHLFQFSEERNIYLSIRDISMQVTLQKERDYSRALLQQQSKMASMGEMVAMIAHQWRQPLNVLMLEASNLRELWHEDCLHEDEFEQYIDSFQKQLEFMNQTISDFQKFFSPSKKKESFHLRALIESVCKLVEPFFVLRSNIQVRITEEQNGEKNPLFGYANELKQVFLVLIQNARDAIMQKGEHFAGEIHIHIARRGAQWHISVEDNGGGIAPSALPQIFEPYFTTKGERGTGIGLTTARMIIEQSFGGSISVRNGARGACFELILQGEQE